MKATIIGAQGFIGSHLRAHLIRRGDEVFAPARGDSAVFTRSLGHVFYCAGLTADFRQKPVEAIRAHVCHLLDILERTNYESLLYLSSTRVYNGGANAAEDADLQVNSANPSDLYNLSKLTGEAACFAFKERRARIARLSNVYGLGQDPVSFLSELIQEALIHGRIVLRASPASAKDYVWVEDVVALLPRIAQESRYSVYNVAAGRNITNQELADRLRGLTGCSIAVAADAPAISFPPISIARIRGEFGFMPSALNSEVLAQLVENFRREFKRSDKDRQG